MTKDLTYDGSVQLVQVGNNWVEYIPNIPPTEEELAAQLLEEKYGGSIQEDQYIGALEQRDLRIESQYFSERG